MATPYVQIAIARPFGGTYTYSWPAYMEPPMLGHVVQIPVRNALDTGYVVGFGVPEDLNLSKIKPIARLLDSVPAFDEEQLSFFRWIANYYLAPLGRVIQTALPSQFRAKTVRGVHATDAGVLALTKKEVAEPAAQVMREVVSRPGFTKRGLNRRLGQELKKSVIEKAVRDLVKVEWLVWQEREVSQAKGMVMVVRATENLPKKKLGSRQQAVLSELADAEGPLLLSELVTRQGPTARAAIKRLVELQLVTKTEEERTDALAEAPALGATTAPQLNSDQLNALAKFTGEEANKTWLLWGVTGSGKTEVFLGAAEHVLAQGKQVLVLVPEIGLTPQLVGRFRARFGSDVAVLHSGLTGAQRIAEWRRIRKGDVRIAVGARSALFAPFVRLGLLVVDEEHDDSYKQDEGVPYSARDLAVVLGKRKGCPVVLASATPAMETWQNAQTGRYGLVRLPKRATPRPVPTVELIDLTKIGGKKGARPLLAPQVQEALEKTFNDGLQAIVLYNRRGYATTVCCTSCGAGWECPNCGVSMTLHKKAYRMVCHYCSLKLNYSESCPVCHDQSMEEQGKGTERVSEIMAKLFPHISMSRMDADTTSARGAHARILDEFRNGKTQLLVGTQIVAKGHDFPKVQTAVVISADRGFRIPDFRAAERTWALLVQLAGRAGRGDIGGQVFVQTYKPDHYVLRHLDNPDGFYKMESRLRATLRYPPFARICLIRVDGVDRRKALDAAEKLGRDLRRSLRTGTGLSVLGPAPAALPRLVGRWRFQLVLKGENPQHWLPFLRQTPELFARTAKGGVRVHWDVDARHLM